MKNTALGVVLMLVMAASDVSAVLIGDPDVQIKGMLHIDGYVLVGFHAQSFIQVKPGISDEYTLRVFKSGGNRDVLSLVKGASGSADYIEALQGNTGEIVFQVQDRGRVFTKSDVYATGTVSGEQVHARGEVSAAVVEIRGEGNDLAEGFKVNGSERDVLPGMVVAISPDKPGELELSTQPYQRTVAGIVSGAGGLRTGIQLGHAEEVARGELVPVALTGRAWCYVDSSEDAITPGDLLTTSQTRGHAMKVQDHAKAMGAVIGKAMTPLPAGQKGLVLVLISLL